MPSRLQKGYAANRTRYLTQAYARKRALAVQRAEYLLESFRAHPCFDCGETAPLVPESDHTADDKSLCIAKGLRDDSWQCVRDEIAKCDDVCANCHRRRTARRG